nr:hypothetical protein [Tanacetum cinerariifolium]
MASTQASTSNPSKKIKLTIIPPRQLFVNISSDEDVTTTHSPITTSSFPSPPNAPSKTPSTNTTSSSFKSKPQSSPPSSNDTPFPQASNPFLENIMDDDFRVEVDVRVLEEEVVFVDGVFDGAFGGDRKEDVVIGECVVVTSSSLEMLTKSCLGGMMVSLIFLEGLEVEA